MALDFDQYYANTILNFSDSGTGAIPGAYGVVGVDRLNPTITTRVAVSPDIVLGNDFDDDFTRVDALLLPPGSSVTVGFSNGRILNSAGNDIRVGGLGLTQGSADVFVSSQLSANPSDFTYLGRTDGSGFNSFDLSAIGFNSVQSIRFVSLPGNNTPEFSVSSVEGLQFQSADGSLRLAGTNRADVLRGSIAADDLSGNGGNDNLFGNGGDDFLRGGTGRDRLTGDAGNDSLSGNEGNDILVGGAGDDFLSGNRGDDLLNGGAGSDSFRGGTGNNLIDSGSGRDFINLSVGRGVDTVRDFGDRQDKLFLPEGLEFRDLTLRQSGRNTVISYNSDTLVTLRGIRTNQITTADVILSEF